MTAQRALLALSYEEACALHFTTSEVPAYDLNIPTLMMMLRLYAVNSRAMAHLNYSTIPHSHDSLVIKPPTQTPRPQHHQEEEEEKPISNPPTP